MRLATFSLGLVLPLLPSLALGARELNGFSLDGALVPEGEILRGGPPRDGIPSIDHPRFVGPEAARKLLGEKGRALVLERGGEVRIYPLAILNWHEIVNDRLGPKALVVSYCPLCGTGVIFSAEVDGRAETFGVSGLLYQSDVLLYDRRTESLWSQIRRQAIAGPLRGERLRVLPSRIVPLADALERHPHARVLSTETGFRRDYRRDPYRGYESSDSLYFPVPRRDEGVPLKEWSILLEKGKDRLVVPLGRLEGERGATRLRVGGAEVSLRHDRERRTLALAEGAKGVTAIAGYWFALRAFYPRARVRGKPAGRARSSVPAAPASPPER